MFKNLKKYISNLVEVEEDTFEFLSHAKNYLSADFLGKGLVFITIPIFTRLLSPDEYGLLSIFKSLVGIFTVLLGFNVWGTVTRYYHEENNDFDKFLGSNLLFVFIVNLFLMSILFLFKKEVASFLDISSYLFIFIILISVFTVIIKIFLSYLQTSKQSKIYAFISVGKSIFVLALSIILMYILEDSKYFGRVYAQFFIVLIFSNIIIYFFKDVFEFDFKLKHIKYSLKIGIPLIPHTLSHFILSHFDKIIINQLTGATNTGVYSFAYNVGMIMSVVVLGMNKAWVPIFYENLRDNNYDKINNLAYKYSKYICIIAIILILFSKEIVIIMSDKSYYSALSLIPIIILGYVGVFLYTLYANYSFYRKKTILISLNTFIAGTTNIGLNYLLIPKFGYTIAAYTTLFSYFLLFELHYLNARFVLKEKLISFNKIFYNLVVLVLVTIGYVFIGNYIDSYYLILVAKFLFLFWGVYYYFIL